MTTSYCLVSDHILLSPTRPLQPGRPGSCIHIPQEQGGPVIPPGTGFPFCRLLRLAGLRWWYYNPPPHGCMTSFSIGRYFIASARTAQKTPFPTISLFMLLICCGYVFTVPLLSNGRLYSFHYSGFSHGIKIHIGLYIKNIQTKSVNGNKSFYEYFFNYSEIYCIILSCH
jgi:hypothetical protein